jgi:hypothetical protein
METARAKTSSSRRWQAFTARSCDAPNSSRPRPVSKNCCIWKVRPQASCSAARGSVWKIARCMRGSALIFQRSAAAFTSGSSSREKISSAVASTAEAKRLA